MRKVWVVVANGTVATIYYAMDVKTLKVKKSFEHFETHLKDEELVSDKPGTMTSRMGYGSHPMQEQTPQKVKERHFFADQLAGFLQKGFQSGEFEHLYLIASPAFLGHLRQSLNNQVNHHIISEIPKDLTHLKPAEILEYLPPVL